MPRLLVILLFGGIAAPIACALVFAIWRKKAVVVMNKEGVTCGGLLERPRHVTWADIVRIDQRWPEMTFIGGPSGQTVLARFPTVGQDLRAIWAVIAHYRPDLGKVPADNRPLLARLIWRHQGTGPSPTPSDARSSAVRVMACVVAVPAVLLTATSLRTQEAPPVEATTPRGFANFASSTCAFEAVEEVSQPARTVTVRRGPDTAEYGWKGEDAPLYSWMEEGWPILPVWSATVQASGVVTVQSWTAAGVTNMMTFRPDGEAILSSHKSAGDTEQLLWSVAVGHCVATNSNRA